MLCSICGNEIPDSSLNCPVCGAVITQITEKPNIVKSSSAVSDYAIASLIVSIIGFFVSFIACIVGLVLGIIGLKSEKRNYAVAGIVISVVGMVIKVFLVLSIVVFVAAILHGVLPIPD